MRAKKRPNQNGYYLYAIKNDMDTILLLYFENGKYCVFKSDIEKDGTVFKGSALDNEYWRFWGPIQIAEAVA